MRWLVEERGVLGFGTETIGTDAGQGRSPQSAVPGASFPSWGGRYGLQCLRNLDQLPATAP